MLAGKRMVLGLAKQTVMAKQQDKRSLGIKKEASTT